MIEQRDKQRGSSPASDADANGLALSSPRKHAQHGQANQPRGPAHIVAFSRTLETVALPKSRRYLSPAMDSRDNPRRPFVFRSSPWTSATPGAAPALSRSATNSGLWLLVACSLLSGCGNDAPTEAGAAATESSEEPASNSEHEGGTTTTTGVEPEEYCDQLCSRVKTCDEDYDRQTCVRECSSQSGVIGNLNPLLLDGLYTCVEKTSCSTIGAEHFVAECLADAASEVEPSSAGKAFCGELKTAADDCSFTDFDERACWNATTAYSSGVLDDGAVCALKKCTLIIDCLDATLKLPTELDGSPIGFDAEGLSSDTEAVPAVFALFPETANEFADPDLPGPDPIPSATEEPSTASTEEPSTTSSLVDDPIPAPPVPTGA